MSKVVVLLYLAATCLCAEMNKSNLSPLGAEESEPNNRPEYVLTKDDKDFVETNVEELKRVLELQEEPLNDKTWSAYVYITIKRNNGGESKQIYEKKYYRSSLSGDVGTVLRKYPLFLKYRYDVTKPEKFYDLGTSFFHWYTLECFEITTNDVEYDLTVYYKYERYSKSK